MLVAFAAEQHADGRLGLVIGLNPNDVNDLLDEETLTLDLREMYERAQANGMPAGRSVEAIDIYFAVNVNDVFMDAFNDRKKAGRHDTVTVLNPEPTNGE